MSPNSPPPSSLIGPIHHKVATEITVIVSGTSEMNGVRLEAGAIIKLPPGAPACFTAITDVTSDVVKDPCVKGDKYLDPEG